MATKFDEHLETLRVKCTVSASEVSIRSVIIRKAGDEFNRIVNKIKSKLSNKVRDAIFKKISKGELELTESIEYKYPHNINYSVDVYVMSTLQLARLLTYYSEIVAEQHEENYKKYSKSLTELVMSRNVELRDRTKEVLDKVYEYDKEFDDDIQQERNNLYMHIENLKQEYGIEE